MSAPERGAPGQPDGTHVLLFITVVLALLLLIGLLLR